MEDTVTYYSISVYLYIYISSKNSDNEEIKWRLKDIEDKLGNHQVQRMNPTQPMIHIEHLHLKVRMPSNVRRRDVVLEELLMNVG